MLGVSVLMPCLTKPTDFQMLQYLTLTIINLMELAKHLAVLVSGILGTGRHPMSRMQTLFG